MVLKDQGYGETMLKHDGEVQIGEKLTSDAQDLLDIASKTTIRLGLDAIDLALQKHWIVIAILVIIAILAVI